MESKLFESKNKLQMQELFSLKGYLLHKSQQNTKKSPAMTSEENPVTGKTQIACFNSDAAKDKENALIYFDLLQF